VLEPAWSACAAGLAETLTLVDDAVALASRTTELEVALTAVADLLLPLETFVDAELAFSALRERRRRS
jgi:hypothetical protein